MPCDMGDRGVRFKFVFKCANFRPLYKSATLLSSIGVSHKLESGTVLKSFDHKAKTGEAGGHGLRRD